MENENGSVIDKLKEVEQLISEYEDKLFISKIKLKEPQLDIDRDMMRSMSVDDLDLIRWEYGEYALYLQKEINKHTSRLTWADTNLKRYLELYANDYPGFQWAERQAQVLNNNEYAQKLHYLKLRAKMALDRLSFIPEKIRFLCDCIKDINFTKKRFQAN